jgi:hypothetical protein
LGVILKCNHHQIGVIPFWHKEISVNFGFIEISFIALTPDNFFGVVAHTQALMSSHSRAAVASIFLSLFVDKI